MSTLVGSGGVFVFALSLVAIVVVGIVLILGALHDDIDLELDLGKFHLRLGHPRRRTRRKQERE